ncbi:hypothetical protein GLOTRDRAFT_115482 [Gloeophyllum trabeum ATCC 11539]|uniref:DUF218 domain-containing protein n=1 Tax=Gloeophyllum trabeum (strain ATCC 11539 / FP-39264 / Madison 617) TaxID=670483 RepID=S7QE02_GLOTA|nr:uncharacterized protein GLOTRDRAFT_115482 [Gloeophyllum trabeum ATCC 11539]EPQ57642.1 hypothetical protein GLOTRDRAFT_115482 [Gloeophyllum trabeum ATCC 11539]
MLPAPVSLVKRGGFRRSSNASRRRLTDDLLLRARITNLGLLLLSAVTAVSLLYNLSYVFATRHASITELNIHGSLGPWSIADTIQRDAGIQKLSHLIIVPGHAIWKGSDPTRVLDEEDWILEPYQRGGGRVGAFLQHIKGGVERALGDERALLVFSGGQTRTASVFTEADSYLRLAMEQGLLPLGFLRATTENYALDSYQNLLYSIARFHEYVGYYPEFISIVGYEMKRERFENVHRTALRWPADRFRYIGVDIAADHSDAAMQGELNNALIPYKKDLYGCHPPLSTKRRNRNPFARFHSYYTSAPELAGLMNYCPESGTSKIFDGPLPWDNL